MAKVSATKVKALLRDGLVAGPLVTICVYAIVAGIVSCRVKKFSEELDAAPSLQTSVATGEVRPPSPVVSTVPEVIKKNPFLVAFPQNVVLASPLASASSQIGDTNAPFAGQTRMAKGPVQDYASKLQHLQTSLRAKDVSSCAALLPSALRLSSRQVACYGPRITITSHPTASVGASGNGLIERPAMGMWWEYGDIKASSGEACAATKLNSLVQEDAQYADTALGLYALLICASGAAGFSLPGVNESLDLSALLAPLSNRSMTLQKASLERASDYDGQPTYKVRVTGKAFVFKASKPASYQFEMVGTNTYIADGESEGVLSFLLRSANSQDASMPYHRAMSLRYLRSINEFDYRLIVSEVPSGSRRYFSDEGELIRSPARAGKHCTGAGWCRNYHEMVGNFDAAGFGRASYSWLPYNTSQAAAVFNIETKADGSGKAYFGHAAAGSNPTAVDITSIKSLQCFPGAPSPKSKQAAVYSGLLQKQTLAYNASTGVWEAVASNIRFSPTPSCDWTTSNDAAAGLASASPTMHQTLTFPRLNNLYPADLYAAEWADLTLPLPPGPTEIVD